MDNLTNIKQLVKKYRNTLVIDINTIQMLRGWIEDVNPETADYYWIYESFGPNTQITHSSCVGSFIPLKDQLNSSNYKRLLQIFNLNRVGSSIINVDLKEMNIN